jgi:hypothetical protein
MQLGAPPRPSTTKTPTVPPAVKDFCVGFTKGFQQGAERALRDQVKEVLTSKDTDWVAIANNVTSIAGEVLSWFG